MVSLGRTLIGRGIERGEFDPGLTLFGLVCFAISATLTVGSLCSGGASSWAWRALASAHIAFGVVYCHRWAALRWLDDSGLLVATVLWIGLLVVGLAVWLLHLLGVIASAGDPQPGPD